jgi:hypothetical protein
MYLALVDELAGLVAASGRDVPVPRLSAKALERAAREEARLVGLWVGPVAALRCGCACHWIMLVHAVRLLAATGSKTGHKTGYWTALNSDLSGTNRTAPVHPPSGRDRGAGAGVLRALGCGAWPARFRSRHPCQW